MTEPAPPPADPAQGQPPADPPTDPPKSDPPADPPADTTDWKAEARKHEKRAKDNFAAVEELAKLKATSMTDTEKAIEKAKAEGRTAAAADYGRKLAEAKFEAAAATAGVDLSEVADLIDVGRFVDDKGEIDEAAIKKAVGKLAKISGKKPPPNRGSGDFPGGAGGPGAPITEEQLATMSPVEVTEAYNAGKLQHLM